MSVIQLKKSIIISCHINWFYICFAKIIYEKPFYSIILVISGDDFLLRISIGEEEIQFQKKEDIYPI